MNEGADAEVMTLPEVANHLQLAERTVLRMAQRGEIPAARIASQWRFMRHLVQDWLVSQMQGCTGNDAHVVAPPVLLALGELIRPSLMVLDLSPGPKGRILRRMVAPLLESGHRHRIRDRRTHHHHDRAAQGRRDPDIQEQKHP
ncbi:MAG: helix-turn-helix domain-containing protein [Planctomycetota bacterium]